MMANRIRLPMVLEAAHITLLATLALTACSPDRRLGEGGTSEETNSISARVTDKSGHPVAGGIVRLRPGDYLAATDSIGAAPVEPAAVQDARTDGYGRFSMDSLPPGSYRLEFGSGDTVGAIVDVQVDSAPRARDLDNVVLIPLATVQGAIDIPPGADGAAVQVYGLERAQKTGTAGKYQVKIPKGGYVFRASSRTAEIPPRTSPEFSVDSGETRNLDFSLFWYYARKVFLNTTAGGAGISEGLGGFPILVRIDSSEADFDTLKAHKSTLGFMNRNGETLPSEMVSWNVILNRAEYWVLLDTLVADSRDQFIYLNTISGLPARVKGAAAVFDQNNGFYGAYHMDRKADLADTVIADASTSKNDALIINSPLSTTGISGGAIALDGISQYITTIRTTLKPRSFNVSVWFRTATGKGGKLIGLSGDSLGLSPHFDRHIWMDDEGYLHFGIHSPRTDAPFPDGKFTLTISDSSRKYNDNQWHQATGQYEAYGALELFVDGALVAGGVSSLDPEGYNGVWRMGFDNLDTWIPKPSSFFFQGALDEIRIAHVTRSPAWIKLSYENLKPGSKFITIP